MSCSTPQQPPVPPPQSAAARLMSPFHSRTRRSRRRAGGGGRRLKSEQQVDGTNWQSERMKRHFITSQPPPLDQQQQQTNCLSLRCKQCACACVCVHVCIIHQLQSNPSAKTNHFPPPCQDWRCACCYAPPTSSVRQQNFICLSCCQRTIPFHSFYSFTNTYSSP